jgi:hypothetical protein
MRLRANLPTAVDICDQQKTVTGFVGGEIGQLERISDECGRARIGVGPGCLEHAQWTPRGGIAALGADQRHHVSQRPTDDRDDDQGQGETELRAGSVKINDGQAKPVHGRWVGLRPVGNSNEYASTPAGMRTEPNSSDQSFGTLPHVFVSRTVRHRQRRLGIRSRPFVAG